MKISDKGEFPKYFTERVDKAKERIYNWEDIDELIKNENKLAGQFSYGNLTPEQFGKKLSEIQTKVPSLIVTSVDELDMIMEYLNLDDDIRNDILGSMKIKTRQAEENGFLTRYSIWFYKSVSGNLSMYCGVQIEVKHKIQKLA